MDLTVFGATGGTGRHFVRLALDAGHVVEAVARRPEAITDRHPNLSVRQGDVLRRETVVVKGSDAVVYLAGPTQRGKTTLYSEGGRNVADAMVEQGVRRLVVVTNALGPQPGYSLPIRIVSAILRSTLLRHPHRDAREFERLIQDYDLDWTVIQPPQLVDTPATGTYRSVLNGWPGGGRKLGREDLAKATLDAIADTATTHAFIGVAY
ncbi:NAD(P)H-binding protein [Streptosporangiaceae bacterium NEAU-GS5]|nr:NAD(P)H-binding protein [Streptosporangiaceae bacterium NEAU-GS5]